MVLKSSLLKTLGGNFLKTPPAIIILADILLFSLIVLTFYIIFLKPSLQKSLEPDKQEVNASAQQIYNSCSGHPSDQCYEEKFTPLVIEKGLNYAQKTVVALQDLDPRIRHCHILSHAISGTITRANPTKWQDLLKIANVDICGGGFLHGILEAHVGYDPNFTITKDSIQQVCMPDGQTQFRNRTCVHILGHLTILESEGKIKPGLEVCSQLPESVQKDCYNGVFMEDSFKTQLVEHKLAQIPVRDEARMIKQQKRCLNYTGIAGESCWIDMAEIFEELYNQDAPTVYKKCQEAPYVAARRSCYFKAATLMGISRNYDSPEKLLSTCSMLSENNQDYQMCTSAIVSGLMHYSVKFTDRALVLCNNVPDKYKKFCFTDLGKRLKEAAPDKSIRQKYCQGADAKYLELCVGQ